MMDGTGVPESPHGGKPPTLTCEGQKISICSSIKSWRLFVIALTVILSSIHIQTLSLSSCFLKKNALNSTFSSFLYLLAFYHQ